MASVKDDQYQRWFSWFSRVERTRFRLHLEVAWFGLIWQLAYHKHHALLWENMIIQHVLIVSSTCPGFLLLQPSVGVQQRDLCTQAAAGKQCPWPHNHPLSPGFGSYIHSAFHGILILSYLTPFTLPELLDLSYNVSKCHKPHPKNTNLHRTGCMPSLKVVLHNFLTSPEHRPQPNIANLYEFKCVHIKAFGTTASLAIVGHGTVAWNCPANAPGKLEVTLQATFASRTSLRGWSSES